LLILKHVLSHSRAGSALIYFLLSSKLNPGVRLVPTCPPRHVAMISSAACRNFWRGWNTARHHHSLIFSPSHVNMNKCNMNWHLVGPNWCGGGGATRDEKGHSLLRAFPALFTVPTHPKTDLTSSRRLAAAYSCVTATWVAAATASAPSGTASIAF
jgi:hypothetical protein